MKKCIVLKHLPIEGILKMDKDRESMNLAIKEYVIPELQTRGFQGSFPHFRRFMKKEIHLLTFQYDSNGGGFVIEVAKADNEPFQTQWGTVIEPKKLTALDLENRVRIHPDGLRENSTPDMWFRYDKRAFFIFNIFKKVARQVLQNLDIAEKVWRANKHVWRAPAYLPYVQPELTDDILKDAEKRLGFKLPTALVELLKIQNGGYIRLSLDDGIHNVIAGIGPNYPSLTDFDFEDAQEYVSFSLKNLIPFDGDGHWYLCLDYRKDIHSPSVTFIDIECNKQKKIAKSFAEYLLLLELEMDETMVIENIPSIEETIEKLSMLLETSIPSPDSWDHGYDLYRFTLGSDDEPEWLWISPNEAPSGFVRSDDKRYNQLKGLVKGSKKRYPELPDNCYLLSFTDGAEEKVLNACSKAGLTLYKFEEYF